MLTVSRDFAPRVLLLHETTSFLNLPKSVKIIKTILNCSWVGRYFQWTRKFADAKKRYKKSLQIDHWSPKALIPLQIHDHSALFCNRHSCYGVKARVWAHRWSCLDCACRLCRLGLAPRIYTRLDRQYIVVNVPWPTVPVPVKNSPLDPQILRLMIKDFSLFFENSEALKRALDWYIAIPTLEFVRHSL